VPKNIFKAAESFVDIMPFFKYNLMKLTDEAVVYSGHGETTIKGRRKVENQFLLA
jgi:hypothetical protein